MNQIMSKNCRCCLFETENENDLEDMRVKSLSSSSDKLFNCFEAYCLLINCSNIDEIMEISADLNICEPCSEQLGSFTLFRDMSQKVNEILRKNKQFGIIKEEPSAIDECFILSDTESEREEKDLSQYQGRSKEYVCSECIQVFENPADLVQHLSTHSSKTREQPQVSTEIKAEVGETTSAASVEYKYKCSKCFGIFQTLGNDV
jgi:DNA-directed RNA polymerase subunit RPC12/RpoP